MSQKYGKKVLAGLLGAVMACTALPAATAMQPAAEDAGDVLFSTGFEDGEGISEFTGRGGVEVMEATTDQAYSGNYSMCVSGREKGWNGPQFRLDDGLCEANEQYIVSVCAKSEWYSTINLSMEYTDAAGERHYSNLKSASGDSWNSFSDVKVSFTSDVSKVYVYVESSDPKCKLYIDDFSLSKAPDVPIEEDIPSLKDVYSSYFKIGTAITPSDLSSKPTMKLVQKHFSGSITLGNEMKPDSVLDQKASIAYAEEDIRWKDADEKMQEQQYEEAAKLYKELSHKSDTVYEEINSRGVKDMRKIYSIDELELANSQQQNRLLSLALIILPFFIAIAIGCVVYLRKQRRKLIQSQLKLQQAQEEVEKSTRNKSLFISNMSHEIRTPLNALSGFSEVLTTPGIDEDTRKQCYEIIQLNSRLLINLLNDVVDISCLDVKNMKFDLKVCDAVPLCEGIIQTVEGIKQTQAALSFETTLPSLEIETDIFRLPQVLINILVNATKFTKEGSIILRLEQNEEGMAQFSVTDTGCGIPLEKQPTIFNRFERVDEKSQGTGIGLSICQFIIDQLGGNIWIDPEYTNGSRFIFTHPLKQAGKA